MTSHTKDFHDLVFDTVNSLHLQLNLRMSEIHTCQLQQGHIPISSAQCMVVGCISYCLNPLWFSLAQRRARAISDPCSLTPSLAQPSHNPVSVPFFRSCLWLCVGSCSLVGTWLRERVAKHTPPTHLRTQAHTQAQKYPHAHTHRHTQHTQHTHAHIDTLNTLNTFKHTYTQKKSLKSTHASPCRCVRGIYGVTQRD